MSYQRMPSIPFSFEAQAVQYPSKGQPGITHHAGDVSAGFGPGAYVDCLLWRDENGVLRGILNYYGRDFPPYEELGNVNIYIHSDWKRRGIATSLLREAFKRWPIDLERQSYSDEGLAFIKAFVARRKGVQG